MLIFALKMVQVTSYGNLQNDENNHQNDEITLKSNHQTNVLNLVLVYWWRSLTI